MAPSPQPFDDLKLAHDVIWNELREGDFTLVNLGSRVLKTETACIVGFALVLEKIKAY